MAMCGPDGVIREFSVPAGTMCSSFTAERATFLEALRDVLSLDPVGICIFFSDCKSASLSMSATSDHPTVSKIIEPINSLASNVELTFQCIPSHAGVHCNDLAVALAERGRVLQQTISVVQNDLGARVTSDLNIRWRDSVFLSY